MLQFVSSAMGATLYEDVTLSRDGTVTARHGYELDDSGVPDGWHVWFEVRTEDGRTLAEASRTERSAERDRRTVAERDRGEVEVRPVLSCERVQRKRTDSKETADGDRP